MTTHKAIQHRKLCFVYLMPEAAGCASGPQRKQRNSREAFDACIKQTAGTGTDSTEQLAKLADLEKQRVITEAEFEAQKTRILA